MPLERLHGRDSTAHNAQRSDAATRREPVPRLRRQLLSLLVLRESVSWPRSWCGSRASPLLRTANWTVDQLERGDHSLDKPPCCSPALDSAAIKLRNC